MLRSGNKMEFCGFSGFRLSAYTIINMYILQIAYSTVHH